MPLLKRVVTLKVMIKPVLLAIFNFSD